MNTTPIDNPVMTIIRKGISKELVSDFCTKGELFRFSTKFNKSRSFWAVMSMECFPFQDLQILTAVAVKDKLPLAKQARYFYCEFL